MATIKDIAREAGVSHGTVSNVLNKTGKVSVEKIQLVLEAAKRLGYMPNAQAQGLRRRTPTSVAVILPSLREDTYLDFYTALQLSLQESGYEASVHTTDDIAGKEETILETLPHSSLTAVVTISCLSGNCIARYEELPCPVVFIDREPDTLKPGNGFLSFDFLAAGTSGAVCSGTGLEKNRSFLRSRRPPFYETAVCRSGRCSGRQSGICSALYL